MTQPWNETDTFPAGALVTHVGAVWQARQPNAGVRPGGAPVTWLCLGTLHFAANENEGGQR